MLVEQDVLRQAKSVYDLSGVTKSIDLCRSVLKIYPDFIQLGILLTQFYQQNGQFDAMLALIRKISQQWDHKNILVSLRKCECLIYCGEISEAIAMLDSLVVQASDNDKVITKIAELYIHCSQHHKVEKCHQKALAIKPNYSPYLYNLSFSKLTLGQVNEAKELVEQVISQTPNDFDAYYNRSTLANAIKTDNHIDQLENLLKKNQKNKQAIISISYALGKEYEDLKQYDSSFSAIDRAAAYRKKSLSYQVSSDVGAINTIIQTFSKENLARVTASNNQNQPIFILGLPRSGTTLVEQILASYRDISSLGEISSFAFSLIHNVGQSNGKMDLIKKSLSTNFERLGERYIHATKGFGLKDDYLIDKTPLNFLYIGLIKKALPKAKIIHLKRHPLDSCYAMYKTLFRTGYPFSYCLDDLGQYYISYHHLMTHWKSLFSEELFDLDYRELVESPEKTINELFSYCQLDVPKNAMDFYKSKTPSATASAAQVRQPIYKTSVQKWKHYSKQLAPLKQLLEANGINCE